MLQLSRLSLPDGGLGFVEDYLVKAAWEGSPLIQRAFPSWESYWEHTKALHAETPQVHIGAFDMVCVGGIAFAPSMDPQVGLCLMALHTFIHPDYRSTGLLKALRREAQKVAQEAGIRWLVYPRRVPEGLLHRYEEI